MLRTLKERLLSRAHEPGLAGLLVNPFYLARSALWKAVSDSAPQLQGDLLDVGCGTKPYRHLLSVRRYVGLDVDSDRTRSLGIADDLYDGQRFPYDAESFDSLLCNQVLEHVFAPDPFVREMCRVLKPEGKLLLTVPFIWDEHEQPYDFARYSSFGLKALLERNGFKVLEQHKLLADASLFCQLFNAYVFKAWRSDISLINILVTFFVMFPVTLLGLVLARVLPKNNDLFLDQVVIAEKV